MSHEILVLIPLGYETVAVIRGCRVHHQEGASNVATHPEWAFGNPDCGACYQLGVDQHQTEPGETCPEPRTPEAMTEQQDVMRRA
jgi:hypothetical protein